MPNPRKFVRWFSKIAPLCKYSCIRLSPVDTFSSSGFKERKSSNIQILKLLFSEIFLETKHNKPEFWELIFSNFESSTLGCFSPAWPTSGTEHLLTWALRIGQPNGAGEEDPFAFTSSQLDLEEPLLFLDSELKSVCDSARTPLPENDLEPSSFFENFHSSLSRIPSELSPTWKFSQCWRTAKQVQAWLQCQVRE